ncbi:hypothetical protein EJ04DRAFT_45768 [Polyplosphaeria fusca]|uniref:Uncharacterized protein n=1 Tax=Polyplosphaeria fusca TaxID=682080 RepID=A0A9P4QT86_9PLEO|nr:hypothetical protein EJ04DRAFT_45768 [Polyplosphaeria fusca]
MSPRTFASGEPVEARMRRLLAMTSVRHVHEQDGIVMMMIALASAAVSGLLMVADLQPTVSHLFSSKKSTHIRSCNFGSRKGAVWNWYFGLSLTLSQLHIFGPHRPFFILLRRLRPTRKALTPPHHLHRADDQTTRAPCTEIAVCGNVLRAPALRRLLVTVSGKYSANLW